jgi:Rrf2 family protein
MNVSAKTEYACIAVLELAMRHESERPVRIRDIAQANGIPARFLVQILLQLKGAGIVSSTRGSAGGYHLARDPAELSLGEVMSISEGQTYELSSNTSRETTASRTLLHAWKGVLAVERDMLFSTMFADLVSRVRGQTEEMYYI